MTVAARTLTDQEQRERRAWFRARWERGVAFNRRCRIRVTRWDADGVEIVLPYAESLSAHEDVFHGGVISALIDTAGAGAVIAGHDFTEGQPAQHRVDVGAVPRTRPRPGGGRLRALCAAGRPGCTSPTSTSGPTAASAPAGRWW